MKILVFDTETTGLPKANNISIYQKNQWPHIVQISYIFYDLSNNYFEYKDHYIKIKPNVIITEESYNIHKISYEYLKQHGKDIKEVLKEFNDYLFNSDIVVGHNLSFDKRMIFVECLRNKVDQKFTQFIDDEKVCKTEYCTMRNGTNLCNIIKLNKNNKTYIKTPSLIELYSILFPTSIIPSNLHNSLIDILCTFRCYIKMAHNIDIIEYNITVKNLFISNFKVNENIDISENIANISFNNDISYNNLIIN